MGAEIRRGRVYSYAKIRSGAEVKSLYLGKGFTLDELLADPDPLRQMLGLATLANRLESVRLKQLGEAVSKEMMNYGFHQHKGQWRRRRVPG